MASQAFSDPAVATVLNESFVCIKIDSELRPDIDKFLMQYLVEMSGQGGWPLNAFLTPDLKPIFALTHAAYLKGDDVSPLPWRQPYGADFANLAAMLAKGGFHVWTSPQTLPWTSLPANSIQQRGTPAADCYRGTCRPY
jgi:hypothetical protein